MKKLEIKLEKCMFWCSLNKLETISCPQKDKEIKKEKWMKTIAIRDKYLSQIVLEGMI